MILRRKIHTTLIFVDIVIIIFALARLYGSIIYGSQFGQDYEELILFSIFILSVVYAAFLHFKFRTAKENIFQRIHYWTCIIVIGAFIIPLAFIFVVYIFNTKLSSDLGFAIGIFYVGWSMILGIVWIINNAIIGSIALNKYEREEEY